MLTVEELLRQRYKVIGPYPGSRFEIGDILIRYEYETSTTGMYTYVTNPVIPLEGKNLRKEDAETMPHLFQPLPWWSDRKVEDMPEYVKVTSTGCSINRDVIVKTEGAAIFEDASLDNMGDLYVLVRDKYFDTRGLTKMNCKNCIPATSEEYELFKQKEK